MKRMFFKPWITLFAAICLCGPTSAQKDTPQDYLPASFHKGRREAARALMPDSSVMVVFAAPVRNFSNDVDYLYHQNPDLYYFTGYKEPNAVLLLFKEEQKDTAGKIYNEIFFVQKKNAEEEQWTGRRLGAEGVRKNLGITHAFNGEDFASFQLDSMRFSEVLFRLPDGLTDDANDKADLFDLVDTFKNKINLPKEYNIRLYNTLNSFAENATAANMTEFIAFLKNAAESNDAFKNSKMINAIMQIKDTADLENVRQLIKKEKWISNKFVAITGSLREIKTPEEMVLLRKAVEISCQGQNEVMKAVRPDMSEMEIQGLHEYVHKKYGAEGVGYGSIVGGGENGCTLHYTQNTKTRVGNDLLLMDVGAEYHSYTADVTRTIPAGGKFSPEQKVIYQIVYDAQEAAFTHLKDGGKFNDAENAGKEVIAQGLLKLGIIKDKKDVDKYYPHGLSHHIGLDVHDRGSYQTFKKGMVVTIEPGIYIPKGSDCDKKWWSIAVRIEDDLLIREKDYELLSVSAPRSVEAIEKLIAQSSAVDDFKLPPLPSDKKKAF